MENFFSLFPSLSLLPRVSSLTWLVFLFKVHNARRVSYSSSTAACRYTKLNLCWRNAEARREVCSRKTFKLKEKNSTFTFAKHETGKRCGGDYASLGGRWRSEDWYERRRKQTSIKTSRHEFPPPRAASNSLLQATFHSYPAMRQKQQKQIRRMWYGERFS